MVINKLTLRSKLRYAFLIIALMSILITGIFSYSTVARIMEDNALKLTQDSVVKSAQIVDERLNKLMLVTMTFMLSNSFQSMLKDASIGNDSQYYTHLTNMDNLFSQARIAEPLIQSIYIWTPIGEFYPLPLNRNRQVSFQDTPLFKRIESEGHNIWVEGHEDTLFTGNPRVVSLILEPVEEYYSVRNVYVVVNIREDGLRKLIGPNTEGGAVRFLMVNDGASVYEERNAFVQEISKSEPIVRIAADSSTGYETFNQEGEKYLLNYAKLGINNWMIMAIQSKKNVLKDLIYVKWMIVLIALISFAVTLIVSSTFTQYLLKPLKRLQVVMKRVEGNDLTARFESDSQDELSQVGFRFNRMLGQIVRLIDEVKHAEADKRAMEIKALSAQMDPHFLYNALNTIYWKLNLKQVEKSQEMVVALSRMFQLGLNQGREITALDRELEHVTQYLELQTFCYENLFTYDIVIKQPWLRKLRVPRIILQPLVENSIIHGFEDRESGGRIVIEIDGDEKKGNWTIAIRDNGQGMEEHTVQSLYQQQLERGYAVGNLINRLKLYFGELASVAIESIPGEGTSILISLPLKGEGLDVHTAS